MRVILRVYPSFIFALFFLYGSLNGQELEPSYIEGKVLQGETYSVEIFSSEPLEVISRENISGTDEVEVLGIGISSEFHYHTDSDFVGETKFVVRAEGYHGGDKYYTAIVVRVVPSLVEAMKDVAVISSDENTVTIDVLSNDVPGFGASTILDIDLVSNGSAELVNDQIVFTKANGFVGQTSFNYTIEDASGYKSSGVVVVNALDETSLAGSTQRYLTASGSPIDILIDEADYALSDNSGVLFGNLNKSGQYFFTYVPNPSSVGIETFTLVNSAGQEIEVVIEILDDQASSSMLRDDVVYTSEGTTVSFDPRMNDLSTDGILIDKSDELQILGTDLVYTPEPGYSGVMEFFYTVLEGATELTASIEIYVGNYLPQLDEYSFITYENIPLVIEYDAPILNYSWSLINEPADGAMSLNVSSSPFIGTCNQQVFGNRLANYIPEEGFTGTDEFTLEYCVDNGACKQVHIIVEVLSSDENCPCYGNDCVWAGDADNDGKVSVKDILAIGYNYGEIGSSRSSISDDWGANHAEDWAFEQEDSEVNNKFADGNGDGIVNSQDAEVLNYNLNLYHDISATEVLAQKDIPLVFVPQTPGPYLIGDLITLDVFVGSADIPVEDLKGVVFSVGFPSDKVDPESIKFTPTRDWLGNGSPVISAVNVSNGILEVGMARTIDVGAFGDGQIGTTQLVVTVDVDGLKPNADELPFDITFNQARVSNSTGKSFKIDAKSLNLTIQLEQTDLDLGPEVMVYPNPSEGQLSFYANNNDELVDVQIYDMMGTLVSSYNNINSKSLDIDHQMAQGIYTAAIKTQKGLTVQKVQVIDLR